MDEVQQEYGEILDDKDLLEVFWADYNASQEYFGPVQADGYELQKMYGSGDGINETDRANLVKTNRDPIAFPYATGTINAVVGADMADRKQIVFRGGDGGFRDEWIAESITQLVTYYMGRCFGHRGDSSAFRDMLITGYGYTESYLDTTKIPLSIEHKCVPFSEMYYDPDSIEDCLADARYCIRERQWTLQECQARWPNKSEALRMGLGTNTFSSHPTAARGTFSASNMSRRKKIRIFDYQYKSYEPRVIWVDPDTGEKKITTQEELQVKKENMQLIADKAKADYQLQIQDQSKQQNPFQPSPVVVPPVAAAPIEEAQISMEVFYRAFIGADVGSQNTGGLVLSHEEISIGKFTYDALTGYAERVEQGHRVRFFGPMRTLFHAQLYLNKALRVYLEIMERGVKGGGFFNIDSFEDDQDIDKFVRDRSTPGMWSAIKGSVSDDNVKFAPSQQVPQGWDAFLRMCIEAISSLTGVTDWWKGTATQERSNVLISNMQERNAIMLNPIMEPLTAMRIAVGITMASIIIKHIPSTDIDRILGNEPVEGITFQYAKGPDGRDMFGPDGKKVQQPIIGEDGITPVRKSDLIKDADVLSFDTIVDVGQASPSQKQSVWQIFTQTGLLQEILQSGVPGIADILLPKLMKYLPIPSEMAKQISEELQKRMDLQEEQQSAQGIMQALINLPPQEIMQIMQSVTEQMNQQQSQKAA